MTAEKVQLQTEDLCHRKTWTEYLLLHEISKAQNPKKDKELSIDNNQQTDFDFKDLQ